MTIDFDKIERELTGDQMQALQKDLLDIRESYGELGGFRGAFFFNRAQSRDDLLGRMAYLTRKKSDGTREIDREGFWEGLGLYLGGTKEIGRGHNVHFSFQDFLDNVDLEETLDAIDERYKNDLLGKRLSRWAWREHHAFNERIARALRIRITGGVDVWKRYRESVVLWDANKEDIRDWLTNEAGFRDFAREYRKEILLRGAKALRGHVSMNIQWGDELFASGSEDDDGLRDVDNFEGWRAILDLYSTEELEELFRSYPTDFVSWVTDWGWLHRLNRDLAVEVILACPEDRLQVLWGEPEWVLGRLTNLQQAKILARGTPWLKQQVFARLGRAASDGSSRAR